MKKIEFNKEKTIKYELEKKVKTSFGGLDNEIWKIERSKGTRKNQRRRMENDEESRKCCSCYSLFLGESAVENAQLIERDFLLIVWGHWDLVVPEIDVQEKLGSISKWVFARRIVVWERKWIVWEGFTWIRLSPTRATFYLTSLLGTHWPTKWYDEANR